MLCFQSVLYCIVLYNDVFTFLYVAVGNKLLLLLLLLLLWSAMHVLFNRVKQRRRILLHRSVGCRRIRPPSLRLCSLDGLTSVFCSENVSILYPYSNHYHIFSPVEANRILYAVFFLDENVFACLSLSKYVIGLCQRIYSVTKKDSSAPSLK